MGSSKFNYNKVQFTLETLKTPEDKISYLYTIKVEVNRIIQCFSKTKFQPLRKYAVKNLFALDGCDELTEFLKKTIGYYNSPEYGDRYISDSILQRHLKEEVIKYKKFLKMIDCDIEYWVIEREKENKNINYNGDRKMEELKSNEVFDVKLNELENSTSIRELKEKQKKIMWNGSKEDLIYFFDQLFGQQLLTIKSYDEIFSILAHYFIDVDGNPIIVEKSAAAKMNLTGHKIPKGYERYIKTIEKLKSQE